MANNPIKRRSRCYCGDLNIITLTLTFIGGIAWRYVMDFAWIIAISSFICAYHIQEREQTIKKFILKIFYLLSVILTLKFQTAYFLLPINARIIPAKGIATIAIATASLPFIAK